MTRVETLAWQQRYPEQPPPYEAPEPIFDGGTSAIRYFWPAGISMQAIEVLDRRQGHFDKFEQLPLGPHGSTLRRRLGNTIRQDVDASLEQATGQKIPTTIEDEWFKLYKHEVVSTFDRENPNKEDRDRKKAELATVEQRIARFRFIREHIDRPGVRTSYLKAYAEKVKIGLREPVFAAPEDPTQSATLKYKAVGVPYAFYLHIRDQRELAENPERFLLANPTGIAVALITADNKLAVQFRGPRNRIYKSQPGASFAGIVNSNRNTEQRGKVVPFTNHSFKREAFKEGYEELGILQRAQERLAGMSGEVVELFAYDKLEAETGEEENDLIGFRIVALAEDKEMIHDEIEAIATSRLTSDEIIEKARTAPRHRNQNPYDFAEQFFFIDATPEAIRQFLTLPTPLPPTHYGTFLAAAATMVFEQSGKNLNASLSWLAEVEEEIQQNWKVIHETVATYYQEHPEAAAERLAKDSEAKFDRYDPTEDPTKQGLKLVFDLMDESGVSYYRPTAAAA